MLHALWYMFVRKLRSPGGISQTMCHDKKLLLCTTCVMQSCMVVLNPHKGFLHQIPGNGANPPPAPSPLLLGLLIEQFITFTASGLFCISYPPIPLLSCFHRVTSTTLSTRKLFVFPRYFPFAIVLFLF